MAGKCESKICPRDKVCNPSSGRCVSRSGKIGKQIRSRSSKSPKQDNLTDREFLMLQTITGLKSYIVSRDKNRVLSGWSRLRKAELVDFIIKKIDVETGKLK